MILLENGRNFGRFLTTTTSCLKTAENKPSTILWGLCWRKQPKFWPSSNNWVSAIFQQPKMFRSFSNKQVSAVFQQFFSAVFHIPEIWCVKAPLVDVDAYQISSELVKNCPSYKTFCFYYKIATLLHFIVQRKSLF